MAQWLSVWTGARHVVQPSACYMLLGTFYTIIGTQFYHLYNVYDNNNHLMVVFCAEHVNSQRALKCIISTVC